jgi:hypothetical protein
MYIGKLSQQYIYNITKIMRMESDFSKSRHFFLELQRMKKQSNFPLRMDGKTLKKKQTYIYGCFRK